MGGKSNIQIDYNRIDQMTGEAESVINGELSSVVSAYGSAGSNMSKSSGETLEAIKEQIEAEKELAGVMSDACTQFIGSIRNAAESFRGLDSTMAGSVELKDR